MSWDARAYLRHGEARTRPAADLLQRVYLEAPETVLDLGCGPGNSTAVLRARYPDAQVVGLDSAPDMLAKARASGIEAEWVEADLRTYQPPGPVELLFSNATLHWLPDHAALFARLVSWLAPGGVLAVQMPNNFRAPSHLEVHSLRAQVPWYSLLSQTFPAIDVRTPAEYHRLFSQLGCTCDIWETEYLHVLDGEDAVVTWLRGSTLVPIRSHLSPTQYALFEDQLAVRLRAHYPPEADNSNKTLFPFRRIFMVAQKPEVSGR